MPIAIDDPASWPPAIMDALLAALPDLRAYHEHRTRIDAEREADRENAKWFDNPPRNPHRRTREALVERIDAEISHLSLLAWHCTRLCDDEIAAVVANGIFTLSPETFATRVQRRLNADDFTPAIADRLLTKSRAADEHRTNQFWFVLTRKPLGQSGVDDLFGYWGGEALYGSHDQDVEIAPILLRLGRPCIVEVAVRHNAIRTYGSLGMNIVRTFELMHSLKDENPPDCEGHTRQVIPPEQVLRIITPDDEDFAAFTTERD